MDNLPNDCTNPRLAASGGKLGLVIGRAAAGCQSCTGSLENKTMPFIFVMYLHVACLCAMCP